MDLSKIITYIGNITFENIIGFFGIVTTSIIFLLISIKSVVDILKSTGLFPKKWTDTIYKNEEERTIRILNELGLLDKVENYRSTAKLLSLDIATVDFDEARNILNNLTKRYTEKHNLVVGDTTQQEINYYINLRKAFLTGEGGRIVQIMCSLIINKAHSENLAFDCIISRKSAMDLIGYEVANKLEVPLVLYHEQKSIVNLKTHSAIPFDYIPDNLKYPIIIDDSIMGGSSMLNLATRFHQETDVKIKHAFVLFARDERASIKLNKIGVTLHYLKLYKDEDLKGLINE